MTEISFLSGEVLFAAIWFGIRIITCIRRRKFNLKQELLLLLMYINLAVILRMVFYPYEKLNGHIQPLLFDPETVFPLRVNFVPFVHILEYDSLHDTLLNIIGNVGLFVPSGIVLPVIYKKLNSFAKVTAAGAIMSLTVEVLQLPFSVRASDVDDLILNTLGCAIGYLIFTVAKFLINATRNNIVQHTNKGATK